MTDRLRLADASVRLDSMPINGRDVEVSPDADERAAIAGQLGITSVETIAVTLHAVRFRGGIRVTGRLRAKVEQPSVVTLEPVRQQIDEPIDRIFLPGGEKPYAGSADAEIFIDLEGDDLPDHFEGNEADLTDLIVETLALSVDLYPRGENDALDPVAAAADLKPESPFAVLQTLKKNNPDER